MDSERNRFEEWYVKNAFNYVRDPLGSRDCSLQWAAWQAAIAEERKEGPDCGRCQKIHLHNWRFGGPWCVFQKGGISECVNGSQFVARPTVRLYAGGDDARPG